MPNSNLSLSLAPVVTLVDSLPYLKLLDLSNTRSSNTSNEIGYLGSGTCIELPSCSNGQVECIFPSSAPPLCPLTSSASFPLLGYVGICILVIVILLCCIAYVWYSRRDRAERRMSFTRDSESPIKPKKAKPPPPRRKTVQKKPPRRKVSFTSNPAMIYSEVPYLGKDGSLSRLWREDVDKATGHRYWFNRKSGEFSWTAPGERKNDEQFSPAGYHEEYGQIQIDLPPDMFEPGVWEMVYDESTNTRYISNNNTGEFRSIPPVKESPSPPSRTGREPAFVTRALDDDEDKAREYDPLWKLEYEIDTDEPYWIDIESGEVSFVPPVTGTIVSAEMLMATGRYNMTQVSMKRNPNIPRNMPKMGSPRSPLAFAGTRELGSPKRSSGIPAFAPRRSSGLESYDMGRKRNSSNALIHHNSKEDVIQSPYRTKEDPRFADRARSTATIEDDPAYLSSLMPHQWIDDSDDPDLNYDSGEE